MEYLGYRYLWTNNKVTIDINKLTIMKTKILDVVKYLDETFHPEYQEDYDNSGFLLGRGENEFRGALVALDLTEDVVDEVLQYGCFNLIVTHHPFIFHGIKRLTGDEETSRLVWKLIQNDIAVYAAHTNLDNLPWGVSGILAEMLGLRNCHILLQKETVCGISHNLPEELLTAIEDEIPLQYKELISSDEVGFGMVGELPDAVECDLFLQHVKKVIGLPMVRTSHHDSRTPVKRVALCGGAGSDFIGDAMAAGADLYLTADLKYHDFQRSNGRMVLADIGHYESEQFAKRIIFRVISRKFCNFAVRISERQHSLVQYI